MKTLSFCNKLKHRRIIHLNLVQDWITVEPESAGNVQIIPNSVYTSTVMLTRSLGNLS